MNILVTGGAGFIGSHIVDALIDAGHEVVIIDDLSMGRMENVHPKAEFFRLDIRSEKVGELFQKFRFDVVIHEAAQMDVRKSVEDPAFDASVNILGTLNLLENARITGVKKFVFASTGGAIYGEQDYFPADEAHPARPISPYGIAKLSVENYLFYYHEIHGLRYISLRYANVYGPRQNPHGEAGVVAIFTRKLLAGNQPVINGDGKQTRDYVYVGDVVKANLLALTHDPPAIFNVGTGIETDVNSLFSIIRDYTNSQSMENHGPAKKGEQRRSVIDSSSLLKTFGWKPSVSLHDGLQRTVEYFRKNS
ncbi:MAG TPA: NAD-dependent epimerase/dehydratase family protein [Bacteroidota bacterium]|nr:NAD-dependent epimerase/dehydratase family protein [Bacteroidota bacterium]